MSNTYTHFSKKVHCTQAQRVWLFTILDYLLEMGAGNDDDLDEDNIALRTLCAKEKGLLGNDALQEVYLQLRDGVCAEGMSCEYFSAVVQEEGEVLDALILCSDGEGSPDFAMLALRLLTGKYPEDYPTPIVLQWASTSDRGGGCGDEFVVYKGQVDTCSLPPPAFMKKVEAGLAAERMAARLAATGSYEHRQGASEVLDVLLAQHFEEMRKKAQELTPLGKAALLLLRGAYTEKDLNDLIFGSSKSN